MTSQAREIGIVEMHNSLSCMQCKAGWFANKQSRFCYTLSNMSVMAYLAIALVVLVLGISIYNKLIADRNQVEAAWSDIDVQLKRRHDLVPRLVTSVKAYADHEQATLTAVTELRTASEATASRPRKAGVEEQLAAAINQLVVVAEAYPDLKADENFLELQTELTDIEDHIQYSRRFYNGAVKLFNTRIQSFPQLLIAKPFGFSEAEYFEVEHADERQTPQIKLSKTE